MPSPMKSTWCLNCSPTSEIMPSPNSAPCKMTGPPLNKYPFPPYSQQKTDLINQLMRSTSSQRAECNQRDQDWANKERDIKITYSFINWLQKRIKENNARLQRLDVNRCESNANFIQDVKNSKKILNMIAFLRRAIKGAKEVFHHPTSCLD